MKTNTMRILFATLIAISVIATGANAFAGKGMGNRDGSRGCNGCGTANGKGDCPYGRMNANLTDEQRAQIDAEREAYFEATKEQRQDIFTKHQALKAEIAKRQPDEKVVENIQKEISELQAGLDQKRLKHIMAIRKINPDAGRGFFMDGRGHHGKGYHSGKGSGMGNGAGDCPYR